MKHVAATAKRYLRRTKVLLNSLTQPHTPFDHDWHRRFYEARSAPLEAKTPYVYPTKRFDGLLAYEVLDLGGVHELAAVARSVTSALGVLLRQARASRVVQVRGCGPARREQMKPVLPQLKQRIRDLVATLVSAEGLSLAGVDDHEVFLDDQPLGRLHPNGGAVADGNHYPADRIGETEADVLTFLLRYPPHRPDRCRRTRNASGRSLRGS